MDKIVIAKTEYRQLRKEATAYRKLAQNIHGLLLRDSVGEVVSDFRKTEMYSEDFLSDVEQGLRKSSIILN